MLILECKTGAGIDSNLLVLDLQEEDGYTGLHHAAKLGNLEIVNMLLETGQVDVNAQVQTDAVVFISIHVAESSSSVVNIS